MLSGFCEDAEWVAGARWKQAGEFGVVELI